MSRSLHNLLEEQFLADFTCINRPTAFSLVPNGMILLVDSTWNLEQINVLHSASLIMHDWHGSLLFTFYKCGKPTFLGTL